MSPAAAPRTQLPLNEAALPDGYTPLAYARWLGAVCELGRLDQVVEVDSLAFPGALVVVNLGGDIRVEPRGRRSPTPRYTQRTGTTTVFREELSSRRLVGPCERTLSVWLDPAFLAGVARDDDRAAAGGARAIDPVDGVDDPHVRWIGLTLHSELRQQFPSGKLFGQSLSTALAVRLMRQTAGAPDRAAVQSAGRAGRREIADAVDYLHAHFARDLSLTELAAVAGLSPYHFARLFKAATGAAPHQYLVRLRVERAKPLLLDRRHTVAHVALRVGFSSQSLFSAHFRRLTGVSPGRFAGKQEPVGVEQEHG